MGSIYAYNRTVSAEAETEFCATLERLQMQDCKIYIDNHARNMGDFSQYAKLLKQLESGDLLYLGSLCVLGDNVLDVKEQWRILTKEKQVDVIVLDMPALDTRKGRDLYGHLVADLVYSLLNYVTDHDLRYTGEFRKFRQQEGIAEAKEKGVRFGRPPKPMPEEFRKICEQWVRKEITAKEAAEMCGVSRTLFYKWAGEIGVQQL